jgi:uncharacterized membrane protein
MSLSAPELWASGQSDDAALALLFLAHVVLLALGSRQAIRILGASGMVTYVTQFLGCVIIR